MFIHLISTLGLTAVITGMWTITVNRVLAADERRNEARLVREGAGAHRAAS